MALWKIKKGLNVPIKGSPEQIISEEKKVSRVALVGYDYIGMKPTMLVAVGDTVKKGQVLFTDKKMEGVKYTAPGSGKVVEINRGTKRVFESIVIELNGSDELMFKSYSKDDIKTLKREKIVEQLIDSGVWTSLRSRPYGKVANPKETPNSVFVTAMDTEPHAPLVPVTLEGKKEAFQSGLEIISKLTEGTVFVCKKPDAAIPAPVMDRVMVEEFSGPHPAGLAGTHIHFLDPVSMKKNVWHIDAQDVAAIGLLFSTGKISVERVISIAGPSVKKPRLLKTRIGACLSELTDNELIEADNRIISGSVLSGRAAFGNVKYLGKYHKQISVLKEGTERVMLGWVAPGFNLFSVKNIVFSKLFPKKEFAFNTALNGGPRAMVPVGSYEKIMPLDILPVFLLRAMLMKDIEEAEKLGALELIEEDLALCSLVSTTKREYGQVLRENLTIIEKEG